MPDTTSILYQMGQLIGTELDLKATQVSLGSTEQELTDLINLRATTVSLGNVESRVAALEAEIDGGTYS